MKEDDGLADGTRRGLTLVLGGVRSGKSAHAECLAGMAPPVIYLATAQAGDEGMRQRIEAHRSRRPATWRTVEEPSRIAEVIAGHAEGSLLLECLSLWLTNLLVETDEAIAREVDELMAALDHAGAPVIVVSSEVGCGLMPANALARRFGDLLGTANQRLAARAHEVYWCVAGIATRIKGRN